MECGPLCRSGGGRLRGGQKTIASSGHAGRARCMGGVGYYGAAAAVEGVGISGISWFVGLEGR